MNGRTYGLNAFDHMIEGATAEVIILARGSEGLNPIVAGGRRTLKALGPARAILNAARHLSVGRHDAVIASYPRSGNTWVKLALLHALVGSPVDLEAQDTLAPYVGAHRHAPRLLPSGGRLIKSHEPFRRCYGWAYRHGVYIVRDGRDVAVSYFFYQLARGLFSGTFGDFLPLFLSGRVDGYGPWHEHVLSWAGSQPVVEKKILIVRYEDLLENPRKIFGQIQQSLGINHPRAPLEDVLDAQSFEHLQDRDRSRVENKTLNPTGIPFFRAGRTGQWMETFTDADAAAFENEAGNALRLFAYQ